MDRPRRRLQPRDMYLAALDIAAATVLFALYWPDFGRQTAVSLDGSAEIHPPGGRLVLWGGLLAASVALPLLARRRRPQAVLAVVLTATAAHALMLGHRWPVPAAALALYTVALTTSRRRSVTWLATGLTTAAATGVLLSLSGPGFGGTASTAFGPERADVIVLAGVDGLVLTAAWAIGRAVRAQRDYAAAAAEQAAHRILTEQRLRLARELHDIVTHSIGLIAVKAGVANHVADARPQEARDALRVIESTSRTALVELRHVLDVLRDGQPGGDALTPSPRLTDLNELVSRAADAGVRVDLNVRGSADLPEAVQLSAYRIVQEALTNVVKHVGPARCEVTVAVDEHTVAIDVVDDGPGASVYKIGHGLTGIRERVEVCGGSLTAGPQPGGGFRVHATLPYALPRHTTQAADR